MVYINMDVLSFLNTDPIKWKTHVFKQNFNANADLSDNANVLT